MRNLVQLITYVDRLSAGGLRDLHLLLTQGALKNVFGGVHLLPFYHPIDGSDAGFDPIDHLSVDSRLGSWSDVQGLSKDLDVMTDVIVNHMSSQSPQFQDFLSKGKASVYDGLFLEPATVFGREPTQADWKAVYRPRPTPAFTAYRLADGSERSLWTTFTANQIDINVEHEQGKKYLDAILDTLASSGVSMIRLDAVGYAVKLANTSCFMMPETFAFIDAFAARAKSKGLEVLVEVHSYYQRQIEIAKKVDWVYDFALPPLVLHALYYKTAKHLAHWASIRPNNALTVLDTHDGIGIVDIGADALNKATSPGLVPPEELDGLVERIHENSQGQSRAATGAAASNLDLYQVNCTFYDALGKRDTWYLLSRLVQFFLPGIPQVYYVGLLAGENDMALLERSKVGRDINRHHYSGDEINTQLQRPVVAELVRLIQWRNAHQAFHGEFSVEFNATEPHKLRMSWRHGKHHASLMADFAAGSYLLDASKS